MSNIVADGLNKLLLQAYNRREKWWLPIVTHRDLDRFQTMKMIRPYGFSALSSVSRRGLHRKDLGRPERR